MSANTLLAETTATVVDPPATRPAAGPAAGPTLPPTMPLDQMVARYLALRDRKEAIVREHKEALKPFTELMGQLEGYLLAALNDANLDAMRSADGTFYKTTQVSVTVSEWSKTLEYIQENNAWELLEGRVSKTAVQAIMEETQAAIPGVNVTRTTVVQVRRA